MLPAPAPATKPSSKPLSSHVRVVLILSLPGDGDQCDVPAQNRQGCGGRGHPRHQGTGGHNRVHQAGTGGEAHANTCTAQEQLYCHRSSLKLK